MATSEKELRHDWWYQHVRGNVAHARRVRAAVIASERESWQEMVAAIDRRIARWNEELERLRRGR